jgi:hypothetical protein
MTQSNDKLTAADKALGEKTEAVKTAVAAADEAAKLADVAGTAVTQSTVAHEAATKAAAAMVAAMEVTVAGKDAFAVVAASSGGDAAASEALKSFEAAAAAAAAARAAADQAVAQAAQQMGDAVGLCLQFSIAQPLAAAGHDDRRFVGCRGGVNERMHDLSPVAGLRRWGPLRRCRSPADQRQSPLP